MTDRRDGRADLAFWLIRHTRRLLPPLGVSVLARIVGQLLGVALMVVAATAIGRAATGGRVRVSGLIGVLVGLALAKAVLRYLEHYAGHWVAFAALQRLRELFFARLVPQAPAATTGRAGAELTGRATRDIDRIEVFFAHTFPPAVSAVLVPAAALIWLAAAVDGRLALVLVPFVAAVVIVLPLLAGGGSWRAARRVAARRGTLAAHLGDDVQGVREVLAFGIAQARLDELDREGRVLTAVRSRAGLVQGARGAIIAAVQSAGLATVALLAHTWSVPATHTAAVLAVAIGVAGPARGVEEFTTGLDAAFAATARVRAVVDAEPVVRDRVRTSDPVGTVSVGGALSVGGAEHGPGGIALDGVTFRYPGDGAGVPALAGVSAGFEAGSWSYVVGVSGSGKSTLATLLLRGRDPDDGAIRLDGRPLTELPLDVLRRRVALVPQRPTLLSGSVADNLRLAAVDADSAQLDAALRVAALDEWAAGLPQGLATPVRERGTNVSGGQLQRLALARALVARPDVLVLDEALSQLDAATARTVRDRLADDRPELTIVEITHRVDVIPQQAPVVVLDRGRVLQAGPAGRLRAAPGAFARLEARA